MKKFLKRLLDAMKNAKTDEERKALYDLIEKIRDDQDKTLDDNFWRDLDREAPLRPPAGARMN